MLEHLLILVAGAPICVVFPPTIFGPRMKGFAVPALIAAIVIRFFVLS